MSGFRGSQLEKNHSSTLTVSDLDDIKIKVWTLDFGVEA